MGNPEMIFFKDQNAIKTDIRWQKIQSLTFLVKPFIEKLLLIGSPLKKFCLRNLYESCLIYNEKQ